MIPGLLVLILGLVLAAAAATVGVAAATVSQLELSRWVTYRLRGSGVSGSLLENPGQVLTTANALTTMGVLAAGAAVPAVLLELTPTFLGVFTVAAIVPLFVSAAYVVPRVLGRRWAEQVVAHAVPWMERLGRILAPFVPRRDPSTRTTLAAVLTGGGTNALATSDEMEVVAGVLAFADRPIRDIMTPRTAIVAIPEGTPVGEAAHAFIQSGYSRYPVLRNSLDEIVGVVHSKDLLFLEPDQPLPVEPVLSAPAGRHAADLLLEMQRSHARLAVVQDEFGGTAGVVSFEDLLTTLVRDLFPSEPVPRTSETPLLELEGGAAIARLADAFGRPFETRGAQTVGGLLVQYLGRIPRVGERLALQGLEFDVVSASAVRVDRVVVRNGPVRTLSLDRSEDHREG